MISAFLQFYNRAIEETSLNEHFDRIPERIREQELEKYYKVHGRPIGGFGGSYILLTAPPGTMFEESYVEAFGDFDETRHQFSAWLANEPGE